MVTEEFILSIGAHAAIYFTLLLRYLLGNWEKFEPKSALHPDERERTMFYLLEERAATNIQKILNTPSKSTSRAYEVKIKDFYANCLDDFRECFYHCRN